MITEYSFKKMGEKLADNLYQKGMCKGIEDLIKKHNWKLQNYIYVNNSEKFVTYLIRLYAILDVVPETILIEMLRENEKNFKKYALAFMVGFLKENNN